MDVHAPPHFVPPRPEIPETSVSWYGFLRGLRTNALQIWPRMPIGRTCWSSPSSLARGSCSMRQTQSIMSWWTTSIIIVVPAPLSASCGRSPAKVFSSARATNGATSAAPSRRRSRRASSQCWRATSRKLPMSHWHGSMPPRRNRMVSQPIDMLAAMQFLALEIAARSMFSLEMNRYGPALRRMIKASRPSRPPLFPRPDVARRHSLAARFRPDAVSPALGRADGRGARGATARAGERSAARPVRRAARGARSRNRAAFSQARLREQMATMIVAGPRRQALTMFWSLYLASLGTGGAETSWRRRLPTSISRVESAGAALAKLPTPEQWLANRCGSIRRPPRSFASRSPTTASAS